MFSTLGISLSTPGGGGGGGLFSRLGDIMRTLGVFSTEWGTMSTVGEYHDECGRHHEYRGIQYTGGYQDEYGGMS